MHYRTISGVLLLDKPQGMSSQQAVHRIRKIYRIKKAGHTGSLDPLATGLLPVCLGEATKYADYLLTAQKTYEVVAQLGICTTTGDAEGEVTKTQVVTTEHIQQFNDVLPQFKGAITQVPPMYSALKYQGQPLYRLARKGIAIERPARHVFIDEIKNISLELGEKMSLRVTCSKGTYIRTLIEDIGNVLGCGAHVAALRRIAVSHFKAEQMITLSALQDMNEAELDKQLLPLTICLAHLHTVVLSAEEAKKIRQGIAVARSTLTFSENEEVQLLDPQEQFIGVGVVQGNQLLAKRLLNTSDYVATQS